VVSLEVFPRSPEWIEIGTVAAIGATGIVTGSRIETETRTGVLVGAVATGTAIMSVGVRETDMAMWS
jgi:CHASE2 domain-containing sensor protein